MEIDLFQDGGQIKIKKNVDHHNANIMPIDSHLPQADPFSLVPTFKFTSVHNFVPTMTKFHQFLISYNSLFLAC